MMIERELVGEFIDAAVKEPDAAARFLATAPGLREALWNVGQTTPHFWSRIDCNL